MENLRKLLGKDVHYSEYNVTVSDIGTISRMIDPSSRIMEIFTSHGKSENAAKNANKRKDQKRKVVTKQVPHAKSFETLLESLAINVARQAAYQSEQGAQTLRRIKSLNDLDNLKEGQAAAAAAVQNQAANPEQQGDAAEHDESQDA